MNRERWETHSEYVVHIEGVRYVRTNGFGSDLAEVADYGTAFIPFGRVIPAADSRHPDRKP